jgi:hypothetical protein
MRSSLKNVIMFSESMANHVPLRIRYSDRTSKEEAFGYIHHIDFNRGMLRLVKGDEQTICIPFAAIESISQPE